MKFKNIFLSLAVIATAVMPSCTDLEPDIYTDVLKDNYFTTTEQFSTLIANAYSNLAGEYGYVYREGYWSMQEYTSDEVVVPTRGTDWFDNGVPMAMHKHTWEENTRDINNGWSFAYGGVAKCNNVINNIYEIAGDDESVYTDVQKSGIAEARTLRAFYHLLAMDLYGNVSIDDNGEKMELKQYTRKEVFEWIESQLLECIPKLDNNVRYGSMTRPVAFMILAKMYLNAEVYTGTARWEECAAYCDSIINGGYGYVINNDYFSAFKKDNVGNPEIIFPIVFDATYANGNMFHLMTLHYVHQKVYGFTTETWNGPCTLESFYNKYADNDARKAQWFVGPIEKDGKVLTYTNDALKDAPAIIVPQVTTLQDPTAANTFEGARFVKFEIEPGIDHHANSDFPIYRYADVLLMKAEALMRINGGSATAEALSLVNEVHSRAGLKDYTAAELTLDELLNERGRELAWEGHRRQDLIRFGKFHTGGWEFIDAHSTNRNIFPIPQWVLDANPGVYTQNNWK